MPPPTPTLYRYAVNREYAVIPNRVETHPDDILWMDRYGSTALHILCQARPPILAARTTTTVTTNSILEDNDENENDDGNDENESELLFRAVQAMIRCHPQVVAWPNLASWTPLHLAVEKRFASPTTRITTRRRQYYHPNNNNHNNDNVVDDDENNQDNHHSVRLTTRLVLELIQACPEAVSVRTQTGFQTNWKTPFHIACMANADYEILYTMLQIHPALLYHQNKKNNDNQQEQLHNELNPIQLLWSENNTNKTVRYFDYHYDGYDENTDDNNNNNNLTQRQERWEEGGEDETTTAATTTATATTRIVSFPRRRRRRIPVPEHEVIHPHKNRMTPYLQDLLTKMALLLQVAYTGNVPTFPTTVPTTDPNELYQDTTNRPKQSSSLSTSSSSSSPTPSFRLLNAICALRCCPRDYVKLILMQPGYQKDIGQPDELGLLPLHYAIRHATTKTTRTTTNYEHQSYTKFLIVSLLEHYPTAASIPNEYGQLPLHMAVGEETEAPPPMVAMGMDDNHPHKNHCHPNHRPVDSSIGLTWHTGGVQELTNAYPNALRTLDPCSGLVPFLQSANHAWQSKGHFSTTYELLRAAPEMILMMHDHDV